MLKRSSLIYSIFLIGGCSTNTQLINETEITSSHEKICEYRAERRYVKQNENTKKYQFINYVLEGISPNILEGERIKVNIKIGEYDSKQKEDIERIIRTSGLNMRIKDKCEGKLSQLIRKEILSGRRESF